mgnify:CR=1 FL=1
MGFAKSKIQMYEEGMELYLKAIDVCPHHVRYAHYYNKYTYQRRGGDNN